MELQLDNCPAVKYFALPVLQIVEGPNGQIAAVLQGISYHVDILWTGDYL